MASRAFMITKQKKRLSSEVFLLHKEQKVNQTHIESSSWRGFKGLLHQVFFFFSFSLRESYSTLKTGFWRTEIQLSYTHRNTWENIRRPKSFWVTNRRDTRLPAAHPQSHGSRALCHSSTQTSPLLPVEAVAIFKMDFFHIYHQEAVWRCVIGHLVRQDTPLFFPRLYYIIFPVLYGEEAAAALESNSNEKGASKTPWRGAFSFPSLQQFQFPFLTARILLGKHEP